MTTPAITIAADGNGADVLMAMLDHGIRHLPVITSRAEVLGVISDLDLLAAETRTPFALRHAITAAEDSDRLREAVQRLDPAVIALHEAGLAPGQISGLISVVADALVRRTIELVVARLKRPPRSSSGWHSAAMHGARPYRPPTSTRASCGPTRPTARRRRHSPATCSRRWPQRAWSDTHGLTATGSAVANAARDWHRNIKAWLDEPADDKALMALSIVLDHRTVHGPADAFGALAPLRVVALRPRVLRMLLRLAVSIKPPTGFLRDFVIEFSGEHRGTLDIKKGGELPVVAIARYRRSCRRSGSDRDAGALASRRRRRGALRPPSPNARRGPRCIHRAPDGSPVEPAPEPRPGGRPRRSQVPRSARPATTFAMPSACRVRCRETWTASCTGAPRRARWSAQRTVEEADDAPLVLGRLGRQSTGMTSARPPGLAVGPAASRYTRLSSSPPAP